MNTTRCRIVYNKDDVNHHLRNYSTYLNNNSSNHVIRCLNKLFNDMDITTKQIMELKYLEHRSITYIEQKTFYKKTAIFDKIKIQKDKLLNLLNNETTEFSEFET